MADDSQRAKARSTFGSSFFENSKAIPAPKNFAAAQQKTANSRPIPTFKVGGAVKKADSGMPRNRPMPYDKMGSKLPRKADGGLTDVRKAAVMQRAMNDQPGVPMTGMGTQPMRVMKNGGKVMKKAEGGVSDFGKAFRDARKMGVDQFTFNGKKYTTEMAKPAAAKPAAPKAPAYTPRAPSPLTVQTYADNKKPLPNTAPKAANQTPNQMYREMMGKSAPTPKAPGKSFSAAMGEVGAIERARNAKKDSERAAAATSRGKTLERFLKGRSYFDKYPEERPEYMRRAEGGTVKPAPNKSGGKKDAEYGDYVISGRPKMPPPKKAAPRPTMPPKTGDKRDAEYGDYVISKAMGGGVQTSADTARKLATEMGGMKHGGVQKKSLGGVLKKIAPYAAMGLVGAALGKKNPLKAGALGAVGALMMGKKKRPIVPPIVPPVAGAGSSVAAGAGGTPVSGQPGVNKYFVNDTFDTTDKNKFMQVKKGGPVGKYAVGGAGKTRLGMAPIKRAQGGAAKVRKGMMTPKGKITPGVKPHKGIGAF